MASFTISEVEGWLVFTAGFLAFAAAGFAAVDIIKSIQMFVASLEQSLKATDLGSQNMQPFITHDWLQAKTTSFYVKIFVFKK